MFRSYSVNAKLCHNPQRNFTELVTDIDGDISKQRILVTEQAVTLYTKDGSYEFSRPLPKFKGAGSGGGSLGDAVSPMPGVIEKVAVEEGAAVEAGDPLVVMIAMKMEYVIKVRGGLPSNHFSSSLSFSGTQGRNCQESQCQAGRLCGEGKGFGIFCRG